MSVPRRFRPVAVLLYAAFLGLLLASYISPLEGIIDGRANVAAKYRDATTGQEGSGRGLKPRWLTAAINAGKTLEDFAV